MRVESHESFRRLSWVYHQLGPNGSRREFLKSDDKQDSGKHSSTLVKNLSKFKVDKSA